MTNSRGENRRIPNKFIRNRNILDVVAAKEVIRQLKKKKKKQGYILKLDFEKAYDMGILVGD